MRAGQEVECVVCAWRATCGKKRAGEPALHCRDFSRDAAFGAGAEKQEPRERHKRIDDVFAGSRK